MIFIFKIAKKSLKKILEGPTKMKNILPKLSITTNLKSFFINIKTFRRLTDLVVIQTFTVTISHFYHESGFLAFFRPLQDQG
jgi:hypothetical protein